MSNICLDDVSDYELLGRILNETSQINKRGEVKAQAFYPKVKRDDESGRESLFTNKISVLRLCRGHNDWRCTWDIHKIKAESFVKNSRNIFRGFIVTNALTVRNFHLEVVQDGHNSNPNHAHIIIPDYHEKYREDITMISEIIPNAIRERLDRLRISMKKIILNRGERYPDNLNYASHSDSICTHCVN